MEARHYDGIEYENSAEMCEKMAAECDTAILAFSTGKDSIAAWLQLRRYFKRIVPYYCYIVPGLSFIEDSLKYYEDFFGCHIYRLPHKALLSWVSACVDQPPNRIAIINEMLYTSDYDESIIGDIIRNCAKLPDAAYVANGIRMADSPFRRISIVQHGAINHNEKRFYPVYDWKKEDLIRAFDESNVKLPVDYRLFGRTFDGTDYRFLKPIKEEYPEDYQKILDWFPFAELEIARRDGIEYIRNSRREVLGI